MTIGHEAAIIDINLLPKEQRPAQVSSWALAFAGGLVLCFLLTIPLAFRAGAARDRADSANELALGAEVELEGVEGELGQARALRIEIDTAASELLLLKTERQALQGGSRPLSEDLFWLYGFGFLPAGAHVTAVDATEGGFVVTGTAAGPLDGVAYAGKLVETGGFPDARMTSYAPGNQSGGTFTVEVTR